MESLVHRMKTIILIHLLLFTLLLNNPVAVNADDTIKDPTSATPQRLIEVLGCMGCHTIKDSGGSLAPDLTQIGSRMTPKQIEAHLTADAATRTHGFMPSFRSVPQEHLQQIATYLYNLK